MAAKSYEEAILEDAPEIFLRLKEDLGTTAADQTRFSRDFTHSGSPALAEDGPIDKAITYSSGSSDQSEYQGNMPITGYPFTIEAWLKTPGTTSSNGRYCRTSFGDASGDAMAQLLLISDGSNNLNVRVFIQDTAVANKAEDDFRILNVLKGEWVYCVIRFVSSNERHIYANGVFLGSSTADNVPFDSSMDVFRLGNSAKTGSQYSDGSIAEPAFYNYDLPEERIRIHHALGRGYTDTESYGYAVMSSGPVAWLRLQEESGTTAADASGNKRDFIQGSGTTLGLDGPLVDETSKSVTYDGTDNNETIRTSEQPITSYPCTFEYWAKVTNNSDRVPIGIGDASNWQDAMRGLLSMGASGEVGASASGINGGTPWGAASQQLPYTLGDQWVHIVCVYASSSERNLYVNGAYCDTDTASKPFPSNMDQMALGRWPRETSGTAGADNQPGSAAEPAWYTRALTAEEARDHYVKAKKILTSNFQNTTLAKCPSLFWRLGEPGGADAIDQSPFRRHGTIAGGVTYGQSGAVVDDSDTAMLFDGVDAQVTYSDGRQFINQYPVTLEALVKLPSSISVSSSYIRLGITDSDGTMKMVAGLNTNSNNKLRAFAEEVGTSTGTINNDCGGKVDNFHHIIVEFLSDTSRKIWLNGVELEEDTTSVSITFANLDTVCVGVEDLGTDAWSEGFCDEFIIYQRQLSSEEKRDQYVASLGRFLSPTHGASDYGYLRLALEHAPTLMWPHNEASGTDAVSADRWGRDGVYAGGFTLGQSGPNANLSAVQYDGVDGEVEYVDVNDMPIKSYPFVIDAWLQSPSTLDPSTGYVFFGIVDSSANDDQFGIQLVTDGSGNIFVRGHVRIGGTSNHIEQNGGVGLAIQNNKFLHCSLVCRSATERELYVHGLSAAGGSGLTSITFPSALNTVVSGKLSTPSPSFYEGFVAMGTFFDHESTESEIRARFMAGRTIFAVEQPYLYEMGQLAPAAHYRLNDILTTTAADLLGIRDLAISGSPTLGASGPIYNKVDDGSIDLDGTDDQAVLADDARVDAYPVAYVGWVASPASPGASSVFCQTGMGDDGTGDNVLAFGLETDGFDNLTPAGYLSSGGVSDNLQPTAPTLEKAVFHHIAWVQRSDTDRELYVNGASVGTDSDSRSFPSSLDDILVGVTAGGVHRAGKVSEFSILRSNVSSDDVLDLYLASFRALELVVTVYQRSISDTVSVDDQVAMAFLHIMVDSIDVDDSVKLTWLKKLSDSIGLSETITATMTFIDTVSDQVNLADSVTNVLRAIALAEDVVEMSEVINARGVFIRSLSDSIETSITINVSGIEYVGLVLNTSNLAISTYAGWDFNSFAEIDGVYIGAGREGIYELDGEDDDGADINWEIDFGYMDFGTEYGKRLPEIFYSCRNDGTILFKVTHVESKGKNKGKKIENWYQATRSSDALTENRVKFKKGAESQYFRLQILNKGDTSIDLEKVDLTPVILMRRQ